MMVNRLDPVQEWSATDFERLADALDQVIGDGGHDRNVDPGMDLGAVPEILRSVAHDVKMEAAEQHRKFEQLRKAILADMKADALIPDDGIAATIAAGLLRRFTLVYKEPHGPAFGEEVVADDYK